MIVDRVRAMDVAMTPNIKGDVKVNIKLSPDSNLNEQSN